MIVRSFRLNFRSRFLTATLSAVVCGTALTLTACGNNGAAQQKAQMPQAMPVQVQTVSAAPVPQSDQYIATIKSRRSATITPQVDGNLVGIYAHSGESVRAGQILMEIDPSKQEATVASAQATEQQKLAVYQYNQIEVERQQKLFDQGVTSRDALDQAKQAFQNSKADYDSAVASTLTQEKQLGYYHIAAPFDGMVGDIPVHLGDYVSSTTVLTRWTPTPISRPTFIFRRSAPGWCAKAFSVEICRQQRQAAGTTPRSISLAPGAGSVARNSGQGAGPFLQRCAARSRCWPA